MSRPRQDPAHARVTLYTAAERMKVSIVTKERVRWGFALVSLLLGDYPNDAQDDRISVEVEDTLRGGRWSMPVWSVGKARRLRARIRATARAMSDAERDEWSRTGRWTTLRRSAK